MLLRRFAGTTLSLMVLGATLLCLVSCGGGTGGTSGASGGDDDGNDILSNWNGHPVDVDPSCSSARLTQYWSS